MAAATADVNRDRVVFRRADRLKIKGLAAKYLPEWALIAIWRPIRIFWLLR
jgi:hypothetical protein